MSNATKYAVAYVLRMTNPEHTQPDYGNSANLVASIVKEKLVRPR